MQQKKNFTVACNQYFGYLSGQTLGEFGKELKTLSYESKLEIAASLSKELGCEIEVTPPKN